MKIMIASDVHGSAYYAAKIKEVFAKEGACLLVLLGDIYNPGPRNPIAAVRDYAPLKVAEVFNSLKDRLMVIKGNCDSQVDTLISEFHFAEEGQLFVAGRRITLTHGHIFNRDELPPACGDALIYGHVHTGFIERKGEFHLLCILLVLIGGGAGCTDHVPCIEEGSARHDGVEIDDAYSLASCA